MLQYKTEQHHSSWIPVLTALCTIKAVSSFDEKLESYEFNCILGE